MIRKFIKNTIQIVISVPVTLAKTVGKGLRILITTVSPRTIPSAITVGLKWSLGGILLLSAKILKTWNLVPNHPLLKQDVYNNNLYLQENHHSYLPLQHQQYNDALEYMAILFFIDGGVDVLKIGGMVIARRKRLASKKAELNSLETELSHNATSLEEFSNKDNKRKGKVKYQEKNQLEDKLAELKEKQELLVEYLQDHENLELNSEDYANVISSAFAIPALIEGFFIFSFNINLLLILIQAGDKFLYRNTIEMDEFWENEFFIEKTNLSTTLLLHCPCFLITGLDILITRFEGRISKAFSNTPLLGALSAGVILYNKSYGVNSYNRTPHITSDKLLRLPEDGPGIFQTEFDRVLHSSIGKFSRREALAKEAAFKKLALFQDEAYIRTRNLRHTKMMFTNFANLFQYYGTLKLAKNIIIIFENIFHVMDILSKEPPKRVKVDNKIRKLQAQSKLRHSGNDFRRTKFANTQENDSLPRKLSDIPTSTSTTFSNSNMQPTVVQSDTQFDVNELNSSEIQPQNNADVEGLELEAPKKEKVKTKGPLIFTDRNSNREDSKTNSEIKSIAEDNNKEDTEKNARKEQILAHYHNCSKDLKYLLRSILDKKAKRVPKSEILALARVLQLDVRDNATGGSVIKVYKQHIVSFHRFQGVTNQAFIADLAQAFDAVGITPLDLDLLEIGNMKNCSGFFNSIHYVLTTKPEIRKMQ